MAKYIVLHHATDIPLEQRVQGFEGRWLDDVGLQAPAILQRGRRAGGHAYAVPTDRIEYRDDGEAAEVWEIHLYEPDMSPIDYGARGGQPFGYA